jgi:cell pole-organizing protein PopZ
MSEQAAPEPTMEEILASIRRIISEDDAPAGEAEAAPAPEAKAQPAPDPEPEPEPEAEPVEAAAEPEPAEDVLELTERVEPPAETVGDIAVYPKEEPAAAAPAPKPEPLAMSQDETLVSDSSAKAAASAFGQLSAAVSMPSDGMTLDGVVRELLRPLLKDWLDQHLAAIVEAKVAEEVERIARTRVR